MNRTKVSGIFGKVSSFVLPGFFAAFTFSATAQQPCMIGVQPYPAAASATGAAQPVVMQPGSGAAAPAQRTLPVTVQPNGQLAINQTPLNQASISNGINAGAASLWGKLHKGSGNGGQNGKGQADSGAPAKPAVACDPSQAAAQAALGKQWPLVPGIYVPVAGDYPGGNYRPAWPLGLDGQRVQFALTNNVAKYSMSNQETMTIRLAVANGAPVLMFDGGMRQCAADIENLPLVLGAVPQTLKIGNFQVYGGQGGPCASMDSYVRSWKAAISLASDPAGNILMNLELKAYSDKGRVSYVYSAPNTEVKNVVTVALAQQRMAEDNARAEAAKVQALRSAERAQNGGIPLGDTASAVKPVVSARHLSVAMQNVNDTGIFIVIHPDGSKVMAAGVRYNVNSGTAEAELNPFLKAGRNTVIFMLMHRPFFIGGGGWQYNASLSADGKTLWQSSDRQGGGELGIQFWKSFLVDKKPNGTYAVQGSSTLQSGKLKPTMIAVNNELITEYRQDQGNAFVSVIGAMFSGGHGGHRSGSHMTQEESQADAADRQMRMNDKAQQEQEAETARANEERRQISEQPSPVSTWYDPH